MILSKCNRCGRTFDYDKVNRNEVTCKHITFWEHDTKMYLCDKCLKAFKKFMKEQYYGFFTYANKRKEKICSKSEIYA